MEVLASVLADGTPAPYGKACTNCVKAKCRCIYRMGGLECERCNRLSKSCVPSQSVRKRNGRRPNVSRAAQLEEKLEDLVALLRNQNNGPQNGPLSAPASAPAPAEAPTTLSVSMPVMIEPLIGPPTDPDAIRGIGPGLSVPMFDLDFHNRPTDPRLAVPAAESISNGVPDNITVRKEDCIFAPARTKCQPDKARPATARGALLSRVFEPRESQGPEVDAVPQDSFRENIPKCEYQPTDLGAEECLKAFRENMLIFFPFIYLPASLTAKQLRESYPFFWFNIMTITCKHVDDQYLMSDAVWRFVAQKMIVEHEKSLDLLWGLITLMAWTQYHRKEKPYFSVLVSLVKSLVYDFCLNKPPREAALSICLRNKAEPLPPKEKTMDERRAVLACFYITSQISHVMKRVDALVWTPYMDECLQLLSRQPEWDGDVILTTQVKIQLLTEQLTRAIWQSPDGVAPAYFSSALRSQLRDLQSQLPAHVLRNPTITAHLLFLELAIAESIDVKPGGQTSYAPDLQRFEALEASLQVIKKWFDNHFSMPSYMYTGVTFMYWCNMGKCITSLTQLAFEVEDPAWDRRAVKERVDIFGILDRLTQGFDDVSHMKRQQSAESIEEDMFTRCARLVRVMKRNWLADTINTDRSLPTGMAVAPQVTLAGQEDDPLSMPIFQMDNTRTQNWMTDFFEMNWDP
ncbi:hypothetical protein QBC34DRAFT_448702 [Podospora aff. communis PSN243]|uniref:Zn(2)-C6 fungal-type domain-containing protein n=1 Tax=Podospora aff. communis PSN243 TaxID=3040156 RepID=A0AAV9GN71_9PEZI|nr:hypothetical protein QBC34DRAFT_448702 [Podospora aff. communis PSN243]